MSGWKVCAEHAATDMAHIDVANGVSHHPNRPAPISTKHQFAFVKMFVRFQSCLAAQEFPDAVIAQLLYHEAVQDFMSNTSRPSLSECQGPEFYEDLADFLQHVLRQDERAQHVRER